MDSEICERKAKFTFLICVQNFWLHLSSKNGILLVEQGITFPHTKNVFLNKDPSCTGDQGH